MNALTFAIHLTLDNQFYFCLRDVVLTKLLASREYDDFHDCVNDIYMIMMYKDYKLENEYPGARGLYRFNMVKTSGKFVAKSAKYYSLREMSEHKELIIEEMVFADVEDHSTAVRFFRYEAK
jgi:hypothetical protein